MQNIKRSEIEKEIEEINEYLFSSQKTLEERWGFFSSFWPGKEISEKILENYREKFHEREGFDVVTCWFFSNRMTVILMNQKRKRMVSMGG